MNIQQAAEIVRAKWDDNDGCRSCGWRSFLYEHEPIEVDAEDLARGYVTFSCFSEDAIENGGHRGIRIYFKTQERT